jgi:WD40 repeat protein
MPDGRYVVSASKDKTLKVWDLKVGSEVATLRGHDSGVSACATMLDRERVITASWDKTLKVWEIGARREVVTLHGHSDGVNACAVTPDGRYAVSASWDKTLRVWDVGAGHEVATLRGHARPPTACMVTPDGRHVVSASWDKTLRVWDLDTGACLLTHYCSAPVIALSATAATIIAGDAAGSIWFLDWPPSDRSAALIRDEHTNAISLQRLTDVDQPQLRVHDGVDAEQAVLAADLSARSSRVSASPHASNDATSRRKVGITHTRSGLAAPHAAPGETRMTRDDLLTRLSNLLPSQFKEVLFRAKVPTAHLSAENAPQATRAIEAIHCLEQQHQLDRLDQILDEVAGPS